jgi:hypothetical protein
MGLKVFLAASAVLLSATTASFAQSLPNYGANAPATGDSYGKPYSGAQPLRTKRGYRAYAYQRHWHHRYHRHPRWQSQY